MPHESGAPRGAKKLMEKESVVLIPQNPVGGAHTPVSTRGSQFWLPGKLCTLRYAGWVSCSLRWRRICYLAKSGLELAIFLPLPLGCKDDRTSLGSAVLVLPRKLTCTTAPAEPPNSTLTTRLFSLEKTGFAKRKRSSLGRNSSAALRHHLTLRSILSLENSKYGLGEH